MSSKTEYALARSAGAGEQQGKRRPPPPGGETAGEIIDHFKAAEERRRILSETLPPPARIMQAADTYSAAAARIFLEAAMRTAVNFERILNPTFEGEVAPNAMEMIGFHMDAHRRVMRDAYLTAAVEMLKMIGGDFVPEPWLYGEEPSAGESSILKQEEERICDLYHELTDSPEERRDDAAAV